MELEELLNSYKESLEKVREAEKISRDLRSKVDDLKAILVDKHKRGESLVTETQAATISEKEIEGYFIKPRTKYTVVIESIV